MAENRSLEVILEFQKECQQLVKAGKWAELDRKKLLQLRNDIKTLDFLCDNLPDFDSPEGELYSKYSNDEQELINVIVERTKKMKAGELVTFASSSLLPATADDDDLRGSNIATQNALGSPLHTSSCSPNPSSVDMSYHGDSDAVVYDKEKDFVGSGPWGNVFSGIFKKTLVAVKVPKNKHKMSPREMRSFQRLKEMMEKTHGGQLVDFIHASLDPEEPMIVTNLMRRDLGCVLHNAFTKPSVQERMKMAYDIAIGMNWLHQVAVAHGGLKPGNVLLKSNGDWLLSDYGFTQFLFENSSVKQLADEGDLSYRYLAPEFIKAHLDPIDPNKGTGSEEDLSVKVDMFAADVYSFGVILYEIVNLRHPFEEFNNLSSFFDNVVTKAYRPEVCSTGKKELDGLLGIALSCWDHDPAKRPSFVSIVNALCEVMLDSAIPPSPANDFWRMHFCSFVSPSTPCTFRTSVSWSEITAHLNPQLTPGDLEVLGNVLCEKDGFDNNSTMSMQRWYQCYLWFGCWFEPDSLPMISAMVDLFNRSWFHGIVSNTEAKMRLSLRDGNLFLVKLSSKDNNIPFVVLTCRLVPNKLYLRKMIDKYRIRRLSYEFEPPDEDRFCFEYEGDDGNLYGIFARTLPELVESLRMNQIVSDPCPQTGEIDLPYSQFSSMGDPSSLSIPATVDDITPIGK